MTKSEQTLSGDAAVALWLKGRDAWNERIRETPNITVNFSGKNLARDLAEHSKSRTPISKPLIIDFEGFIFPRGGTLFYETDFGAGGASFRNATFSGPRVDFRKAVFSGSKTIDFSNIEIDLDNGGECLMDSVQFGNGPVYFDEAIFNCDFFSARNTTVGNGGVSFRRCRFGKTKIVLDGSHFIGPFSFLPNYDASGIVGLSMSACRFENVIVLEGFFHCIPDLRRTIVNGHVDLDGLVVATLTDRVALSRSELEDHNRKTDQKTSNTRRLRTPDAPALRRLKEISENNKHYDAALRFFAEERRAMRWDDLNVRTSIVDWFYDILSLYGQSIGRPIFGSLVTTLIFAIVYYIIALPCLSHIDCLSESFSVSIANTVSFVPSAREIRADSLKVLFDENPDFWMDVIMVIHGSLAFLFLFLIGLGVRNRFRL